MTATDGNPAGGGWAAQTHHGRPLPDMYHGLFLGVNPQPDGGTGASVTGRHRSMLVLGPPRSGKTTALVIPNVLIALGAVVSTSTKTEVIERTGGYRSKRGRCWLFDPSGSLDVPEWMTPLRWSPVPGAQNWTAAVAAAHALAGAATRHARRTSDSDHWIERAEALLAPLLHAAALHGLAVEWVLRWVLRRETTEPAGLIIRKGGHDLAAETLAGIAATDERERSGIFSTAAGVLAAYRSSEALAVAERPNFDPDAFVRSSDTLYICSSAEEQNLYAPLVVALLDRVRRATYRREAGWPPVTWVLDEVANIAPLPNLPAIVSEGAGQGLIVLACLQDLSQARGRWGPAADGFLTLFSHKVVLRGISDHATLSLISALAGDTYIPVRSTSHSYGYYGADSETWTPMRVPALPVDQVHRIPDGQALLIGSGGQPGLLRLVPCWMPPFGV